MICTFNNWQPLLSLLLSVVAIAIAVWSSRQTSKEATRQIEGIKELARIQIEVSIKQVELEIERNELMAIQAENEWHHIYDINHAGLASSSEWKREVTQQFNQEKPKRDYELYSGFINKLHDIKDSLVATKQRIDIDKV